MLPGQNYKELIQEHGEIEQKIASGWGYQINPTQFVPKKLKIETHIKVINMEPLKVVVDVPISKRLQNIEEQLLMMQNQRRLNLLTEEAKHRIQKGEKLQNESAAVKMMHQLVDQYNFIVDHRHIIEKKSEKARRILGIKKTASEIINQQIETLRQQLASSTVAEVIKINQQIATLYRRYQQNLFNSKTKNNTEHNTVNNTVTNSTVIKKQSPFQRNQTHTSGVSHILMSGRFSPWKKTSKARSEAHTSQKHNSNNKQDNLIQIKDLMIMKQLNESEQGESRDNYDINDINQIHQNDKELSQPQSMILQNYIQKLQRRTSQFVGRRRVFTVSDHKQKEKEMKKQRMMTTITESFVNKQVIEKGKNLDKTLRQNQDVIQIWKHKINQNVQKNARTFLKFQPKAKKFKKSVKKLKPQQNDNSQQIDIEQKRIKQKNLAERLAEIKSDMAQKERVFSIIIRKKQSKYKRLPGTQILHQANANQTAKTYLGTSQRQKSKTCSRQNSSCNQNIVPQTNNTSMDVPEWMNMGYGHDQEFYWSMCRNEKLNLLLKHHKK